MRCVSPGVEQIGIVFVDFISYVLLGFAFTAGVTESQRSSDWKRGP